MIKHNYLRMYCIHCLYFLWIIFNKNLFGEYVTIFQLVHKQMLNFRLQGFTPNLRECFFETNLLIFVTDIHLIVVIDILNLLYAILLIKEL